MNDLKTINLTLESFTPWEVQQMYNNAFKAHDALFHTGDEIDRELVEHHQTLIEKLDSWLAVLTGPHYAG